MRKRWHCVAGERRQQAERFGRRAESLASLWLMLRGWRILARRVKTHAGEVDLIARRGRIVAFIEVKARRTEAQLALAIDARRLKRVAAAANQLWQSYARPGDDVRIDVMLLAPRRWPRHIENAWQP